MDGEVQDRSDEAASGQRPDFLDPVLWRRLSSAESLSDTADVWCTILASQIPSAKTVSVLVKDSGGGPLTRMASWPANRVPGADALIAADAAVENQRGVVRASGPSRSGSNDVSLATPLVLEGTSGGVVVLECPETSEAGVRGIMRQLQWGSAWLRDALREEVIAAERERLAAVGHALHVIVAVAEQDGFEADKITQRNQRCRVIYDNTGVFQRDETEEQADTGRHAEL